MSAGEFFTDTDGEVVTLPPPPPGLDGRLRYVFQTGKVPTQSIVKVEARRLSVDDNLCPNGHVDAGPCVLPGGHDCPHLAGHGYLIVETIRIERAWPGLLGGEQ